MPESKPLLLEIGCEELPSSFVDGAISAIPEIISTRLSALRLTHGIVRALGTARRLAVLVDGLATSQTDLDEEVLGPPESAAFKDGKPTKAAEAFATKNGVGLADIFVAEVPEKAAGAKQKAGRYAALRKVEKGRPARELLGKTLTEVCAAIPFRKSMRWADGDATFGRPVQWLVALFGDELIETSFAGVRAGRETRGHRFLAPAVFSIASPASYESQLLAAHVIVDRTARARIMMERVVTAAKAAGGVHDPEPYLEDENASLVEEPHIVTGSFDPAFLELPATVIRAVARGHQKYFCVQVDDDTLLPHYLAVVNTALDVPSVVKGNDRVMRGRLSDARFFFDEDKKVRLDTRAEKLASIVFHNRLGTVAEKVSRMGALAAEIALKLGVSQETTRNIETAARLCKADLPSLMVGEFPELQGHMGRAYAKHEGQPAAVADAIRDHYRPLGAHDAVAPSDVSAAVALADRLDTLTGCFALGLAPTGAADPFGLRRACIAVLRTLTDAGQLTGNAGYARLDLAELIGLAYDKFGARRLDLSREETVAKVIEFATERLRGLLTTRASGTVADAVLAGFAEVSGKRHAVVHFPVYATAKATALKAVVDRAEPWLAKAKLVTKRLAGISKETAPTAPTMATFKGAIAAKHDSDRTIVALVTRIAEHTDALHTEADVQRALSDTEDAALRLDEIFTNILVNDPADTDTKARLGVLSYGAQCMLRIADFSRLG
jgi:glycyl-tRNA synthetase beta chain